MKLLLLLSCATALSGCGEASDPFAPFRREREPVVIYIPAPPPPIVEPEPPKEPEPPIIVVEPIPLPPAPPKKLPPIVKRPKAKPIKLTPPSAESCEEVRRGVGMPCFVIRAHVHIYEAWTIEQKRHATLCLSAAEREAIAACFRDF